MSSTWLICIPPIHPFPFPVEDRGTFYVVMRGHNPGIYRNRTHADYQLIAELDYWVRATGWNEAWKTWMSHCYHRHKTEDHLHCNVLEEVLPEALSAPFSPHPGRSSGSGSPCHSAGTPPPSPELFAQQLTEALEELQAHSE
ncbi:hypothetical protein GGX14DRAFT_571423 [Mycena pura]|uniref:Uncharacterized protein n=1 Tax=Mycena pura TaxID=153505 RepID=A0AAD6Y9T8_9AGAR|nr:hypothetical protein GGX14DRAFT_571423 [Mycena pura]